jgi:hypothetical protein
MSDPKLANAVRLTLASNLALLEEMKARLSRLRANRFQCRVSVIEAKRIKEKLPVPPTTDA